VSRESIIRRLAALERSPRRGSLPASPSRFGSAADIRELDKLTARTEAHISELKQAPESYVEDYDIHLYGGETLSAHRHRVEELFRRYDEEHEAWCIENRPDLDGRGVPEIDNHLAELDKEIALLELEIATESGANEGGGG